VELPSSALTFALTYGIHVGSCRPVRFVPSSFIETELCGWLVGGLETY